MSAIDLLGIVLVAPDDLIGLVFYESGVAVQGLAIIVEIIIWKPRDGLQDLLGLKDYFVFG